VPKVGRILSLIFPIKTNNTKSHKELSLLLINLMLEEKYFFMEPKRTPFESIDVPTLISNRF